MTLAEAQRIITSSRSRAELGAVAEALHDGIQEVLHEAIDAAEAGDWNEIAALLEFAARYHERQIQHTRKVN